MYESSAANEMAPDAHGYYGDWPMVINTLIQRFLTKNVLQKAQDLLL